ncbi:MAG TPA: hypothetical protein VN578_18330, partial [Candidatus Binatia bacterium]|nr:hypothetical protein [Candidatus Binatia bacterium]
RLEGVVLKRTNGGAQIQQSFSVALSLDPLTNDPQLVGREIRNHLEAAGVRERRCVVGLPLKWALTAHIKLPELPEADVESFLQLEAERGFPCDVATLLVSTSRYAPRDDEHYATLVGLPRSQVELLERGLRAAQLKPVSFSLGLTALQNPAVEAPGGVLALAIGETHVGLQVTCGGGIAALRALEGALETEGGHRQLRADIVARETRITLAQLPASIRETVRRVRIFGARDLAQQLADEIELRLEPLGLRVELVTGYTDGDFKVHLPREALVAPALSLAARQLTGPASGLEFLPPKVSAWQQFAARYSSGKLQQAGVAAAAVVLLVGGAFLVQQAQLWHWQSQWDKMKNTVQEVEATQGTIRQFRAWYDPSVRGLTILRKLTEAFPEDNSVTAKTVEIRDLSTVTCSGTARNYQALLRTVERLRAVPQFREVNLGSTRGQAPAMQFTFNLVWNEGGGNAN